MTPTKGPSADTEPLVQAQIAVQQARNRLASTAGALQYRLKPGTLVGNMWDGVRGKSGEMADDALQAVKSRPVTVSGVIAAIIIFLAREPLWTFLSGLFSRGSEEEEGVIRADFKNHDSNVDLTAPTVPRSVNEGVNA